LGELSVVDACLDLSWSTRSVKCQVTFELEKGIKVALLSRIKELFLLGKILKHF
jgi:hypothetical protein